MYSTTYPSEGQARNPSKRDSGNPPPCDDPPSLQLALRLSRYVRVTAVYAQDGDRCLCDDPGCDAAYWPDDAHEVTSPISDTDLDRLRELRSELAVVGVDGERRRELLRERVRLDAADSIGGSLTCDPEQLRQMWRELPDAIPAVGFHDFSERTFRPLFAVVDNPERLLELTDAELLFELTDQHPRGDDIRRELEDAELERALENFDASLRATIREAARKLVAELPALPAAPQDPAHKTTLAWLGRFEKAERTVAMDELFAALEESERTEIVRKIVNVPMSLPPAKEESDYPPSPDEYIQAATAKYTDLSNTKRMIELGGGDFRFCPELGWLTWEDTHWRVHPSKDAPGKVVQLAKSTVRELFAEAQKKLKELEALQALETADLSELDPDEKTKLADEATAKAKQWSRALAHAIKSQNDRPLRAMVTLARSEPFVEVRFSDLDKDHLLVNSWNGTIDLRSGRLREHRRKDLLTHITGATFDSNARCPVWSRFLDDLTGGDRELERFLQKAFGYALSGDPVEEKLFLLIGPPNAGKTTLLEAVRAAAGSYAATASAATFVAARRSDGSAASPDIARLAGKRVVLTSETKRGVKLEESAETFIKLLTGGDTVIGRHLYRAPFEFRPTFVLFLSSNFDVIVSADDEALWRRLVRIPCNHAAAQPDKTIKATLTRNPASLSAILTWMVHGFRLYLDEGLEAPSAVVQSVRAYRIRLDSFTSFLERCCRFTKDGFTATSALHDVYVQHHRGNGYDRAPLAARAFGKRLAAVQGLASHKRSGGERGWRGIELLPAEERPQDDS